MPHKLDIDTLITPALLRRLDAESQYETGVSMPFWAVLERDTAHDFIVHRGNRGRAPLPPQQMMALDLVHDLNREIHHDGAWVALWSHPGRGIISPAGDDYQRLAVMWMDSDGDVQFTIELEGTLEERLMKGVLHWLEIAETSWQEWFLHMRVVLDPQPDELFKRAKGQNAPSSTRKH